MFKNKTAIITGGSRGIGREIALKLASLGANIVINYRSSDIDDLITEIEAMNVKVIGVKGDVANLEDCNTLIKTAYEEFKTVDILVNNAGITKDNLLLRMSEKEFDDVIAVNLKGTFNTIKSISPYMIKQRSGKIVNLASVVGVAGNAGQANYCASKAGVIGLTKSVAKELAVRGINCNAVAPGFISTDMTDSLNEKVKEKSLEAIPLKRFGDAKDVANVVAFLCSEEASYITGQVINVDGGMVM